MPEPTSKWVYSFSEGSRDMRDLLGGKGANVAEMTGLGLPVPPGFTTIGAASSSGDFFRDANSALSCSISVA